jgi:hypothetical protein
MNQSTTSTGAAEDHVGRFQPISIVQVSGVEFEHKPQPYGLGDSIPTWGKPSDEVIARSRKLMYI